MKTHVLTQSEVKRIDDLKPEANYTKNQKTPHKLEQ
jgi:hypothetical protein